MITYRLDSENRLVDVGGDWEQFARDNDGDGLSRDYVVGRPLFAFIEGPSIVQMYRAIFNKVRQTQKIIAFDFRCDAPVCRRRIRLQVAPGTDDSVELTAAIVESTVREPVPLFDKKVPRSQEKICICCICSDVQSEGRRWVGIEEETTRLKLMESDAIPQLSYGYCPRCLEAQIKMLESLGATSSASPENASR